jgi:hypothetical protein
MDAKQDILDMALEALQAATGLIGKTTPDARLTIRKEDQEATYWVEVKPTISEIMAVQAKQRFDLAQRQGLIVTRFVPTHLARKLRALDIQFTDTVGNAYINNPPFFVFTYGNKPTEDGTARTKKGVFTNAGAKVIFALLCQPKLENATYRQIAEVAAVALGTVDTVMKRLQRKQYLLDFGTRGRRLERKRELFERWVDAYAELLRPMQLIGTFKGARDVDWTQVEDVGPLNLWGGEVAAAKLTQYLKPQIVTIYTQRPAKDLIQRFKLTRNPDGNVELREIFWGNQLTTPVANIVPPLLVYADLMATVDPRNIETAKLIYDEYIQGHLRED